MRATGRFRRWMFPLRLSSAAVLSPEAGTARGGELGTCYVATIRETFAIPEGGVHPPGRLRICESTRLSPVETLHVISVDGMPEGAFRFRATSPTDRQLADGSAVFLFGRDAGGRLRLEGYAARKGSEERSVALRPSGARPIGDSMVIAAMRAW